MLSEFNKAGRLHLLYGNHDIVKRRKAIWNATAAPITANHPAVKSSLLTKTATEGLILKSTCGNEELFWFMDIRAIS